MKLVLLPLVLLVALTRADNEDGVVYDAFQAPIPATSYMYQEYAIQDCSSVEVSQESAVLVYNVDFSRAVAKTFQIEAAADYATGYVTEVFVRLDSETADPIATVLVTATDFIQFSVVVSPSPDTVIHRVFLTFSSNAPGPILNLRDFQFLA